MVNLPEAILAGEPIPEEFRQLIAAIVRDHSPLQQALAVQRYLDLGMGMHKASGGAYALAAAACLKSPSSCEASYSRFREYLESIPVF